LPSSIETGQTLPIIGHLYDYTGAAATFKQSFKLLNTPAPNLSINGQGASAIVLELEAPLSGGNAAPAKGDIVTLTQDGGDGSVIFKGIFEDDPDMRGDMNAHELLVNPVGVQLGDTPFETNYTSATDTGQIARDIVTACPNLTYDVTSIPLSGVTVIFDFSGQSFTCLTALDELRKMSSVNHYYWPDTAGKVTFKAANMAAPSTHTVMVAPQTSARKRTAPVSKRKNIIKGWGAVLANATSPITRTYDNSAGSPLGKRRLVPDLTYPKLTDATTLQSIVNIVGSALDRQIVSIELDVVNYATRIQPGDTLRYFEEAVNEQPESAVGTGAASPTYVVLSAQPYGPVQHVVASDTPITLDSLKYLIDGMIARSSVVATGSVPAGSVSTITPGMMGTGIPSTPAAPTTSSAIDQLAQANNATVTVSWLANPPGDLVGNYRVRWRKGAVPHTYVDAAGGNLSLTVHGLIPGTSYGFSVAAVNSLSNVGAWSSETTQVTAVDVAAPATPTGLSAIKSPRGALVSWNGNTEADLKGYQLQVSLGGAGFVLVTPDPSLTTSLAYVAPTATPFGTTLAFQVRAVDWSGNVSAWTASSNASTDSVFTSDVSQSILGSSSVANPGFEDVQANGLPASWSKDFEGASGSVTQDTSNAFNGAAALAIGATTIQQESAASQGFAVSPGDIWYFSVWAKASVNTSAGFYFRILTGTTQNFARGDAGVALTDIVGNVGLSTSYQKFEGKVTIPAGASWCRVALYNYQPSATNTTYCDDVIAIKSIGTAMIQNLAVTNAQIANMVVDKLLAGNLTVFGLLTTGGLRTAASGARASIDSSGFKVFDGSATDWGGGAGVVFSADNAGNVFAKGTIAASNVYGSTVATSASVGTTGNAGFKLSGAFLDFFTIGSTPEGMRYYYAPNGSTAFTLAGQLAANSMDLGLFGAAVSKIGLQITNFIALEAVTTDTGNGARGFVSTQYSNTTSEAQFAGRKARGTQASPVSVNNGDLIMAIYPVGYDGSHWWEVGWMGWIVNGTVAANTIPADFVIFTGAIGSNVTESFRLDSKGHLGLFYTLGGPTLGALQAGIASQSITGSDNAMTVQTTVGGAAVGAFTAMAIVNYFSAYTQVPRHGYANVPTIGGAVAPIYFTPDTTTTFTIHTHTGLVATAQNAYSVITIGN